MTTIWKFSLPVQALDDVIQVEIPRGAKILSVGNQNESLAFWAEVEDTQTKRETRRFRVAGTGHKLDEFGGFLRGRFLGSVQFAGGNLVFHIYEEA